MCCNSRRKHDQSEQDTQTMVTLFRGLEVDICTTGGIIAMFAFRPFPDSFPFGWHLFQKSHWFEVCDAAAVRMHSPSLFALVQPCHCTDPAEAAFERGCGAAGFVGPFG